MVDPLKKILEPVKALQKIRGVDLPIGLEFLQLVVTGPPGAGKSYYIEQIRGWPNEGYLDLTHKGWWKDQSLIHRPREVHLGLPFKGNPEALTVFDKEWLTSSYPLALELSRIILPPVKERTLQTNWRNRYIFEFLIPPPSTIFKQRMDRQKLGYFPVDKNLTRDMVRQQVAVYRETALYLHRAGLNVYIRKGLDKPPMWIAESGVANVPRWTLDNTQKKPSLQTAGLKWLFRRHYPIKWLVLESKPQPLLDRGRVAHDGRSFELFLGDIRLRFQPEIALGVKKKAMHKNWIITIKKGHSVRSIQGFLRIRVGETIVLGRHSKEYSDLLYFDESVAKRHVSITNVKGDLILTPITTEKDTRIVRRNDLDYRERLARDRHKSLLDIRTLYGGIIEPLPSAEALQTLKKVNKVLASEKFRPLNKQGKPGGLVELDSKATLVLVGDLHAQVDNLLKILSENSLLRCLRMKKANLILLGDTTHSENLGEMDRFETSMLIMDLIFTLKLKFPENVFYIRGNHDSFSPEINKNGILQGELFKDTLSEIRGDQYVFEMELFYARLPYLICTQNLIACHAGPPRGGGSLKKKDLINISSNPKLIKELTTSRLQRPNYPVGYVKADVKMFRKIMELPPKTPFVVGHTPIDPFGGFWLNAGTITNHHIVFSAHEDGPSAIIGTQNSLMPVSYPAEPLTQLINNL